MSPEIKNFVGLRIAKKTLKFPISTIKFLSSRDGILVRSYGFNVFDNKPITAKPIPDNPSNKIDDFQKLSPESPETIKNTVGEI